MPYFICPNCRRRTVDHDGLEDLTNERVGCSSCGFGFLFELMDDYYPAPGTGFVVCDQGGRILAAGRGVFELTGFHERELLGRALGDALGLETQGEQHPAGLALEWGVRRLDQKVAVRTRAGSAKEIKADFFPGYDEDGGLLVEPAAGFPLDRSLAEAPARAFELRRKGARPRRQLVRVQGEIDGPHGPTLGGRLARMARRR